MRSELALDDRASTLVIVSEGVTDPDLFASVTGR
jgi:hypothetical protein